MKARKVKLKGPRHHGACFCGWTGVFWTEEEMKQALYGGHLHEVRLEELAYKMDPEMSLQAWLRRQFRAEAREQSEMTGGKK